MLAASAFDGLIPFKAIVNSNTERGRERKRERGRERERERERERGRERGRERLLSLIHI